MKKIDLFKLADTYEDTEVYNSVMDGKRIVFRDEKGDYLEVILFERNNEWRYILDNFPSQRKIFNSNIPVRSIDDFENDLIRMGIKLPKRKCLHPEQSRQHNPDDEEDVCEDCGKKFS